MQINLILFTDTPTRPIRPISAKVISTTPPIDPNIKIPRVASAGMLRRGPFIRPHPPDHPPNGYQTQGQTSATAQNATAEWEARNGFSSRAASAWMMPGNSVPNGNGIEDGNFRSGSRNLTNGGQNPVTANGRMSQEFVQTANGLHLDRTPTDEEINWLWAKVRSCLKGDSSTGGPSSNQSAAPPSNSATNASRQSARVSDAVPSSTVQSVSRVSNTYANNYMGSTYPARRRVTMDTLAAVSKRSNAESLLLQRKPPPQPSMAAVSQAAPAPVAVQTTMFAYTAAGSRKAVAGGVMPQSGGTGVIEYANSNGRFYERQTDWFGSGRTSTTMVVWWFEQLVCLARVELVCWVKSGSAETGLQIVLIG